MSLAAHLTLLVVAAVVITTILVVGTLLAADIIQLGRRDEPPAPEAEGSAPEGAPEALAPLGSALAAGSRLRDPR